MMDVSERVAQRWAQNGGRTDTRGLPLVRVRIRAVEGPAPTEAEVIATASAVLPPAWCVVGAASFNGYVCASVEGPVACDCGSRDCRAVQSGRGEVSAPTLPALRNGLLKLLAESAAPMGEA